MRNGLRFAQRADLGPPLLRLEHARLEQAHPDTLASRHKLEDAYRRTGR